MMMMMVHALLHRQRDQIGDLYDDDHDDGGDDGDNHDVGSCSTSPTKRSDR